MRGRQLELFVYNNGKRRRVMCMCGFEFWSASALVKHMSQTGHKRTVSVPMLKRKNRQGR